MAEHIQFADEVSELKVPDENSRLEPTTGSAGLRTQLPGMATTVSNAARATGSRGSTPKTPSGIAPGNLIETATERKIYKIKSE